MELDRIGESDAVVADGTVLARIRSGRLALVCATDLMDINKKETALMCLLYLYRYCS